MDILATALSGIQASQNRTLVAANNLANVVTPGFEAQRVDSSTGPGGNGVQTDSLSLSRAASVNGASNVDIAEELINLTVEENVLQANINVAKTANDLSKSVLDLLA